MVRLLRSSWNVRCMRGGAGQETSATTKAMMKAGKEAALDRLCDEVEKGTRSVKERVLAESLYAILSSAGASNSSCAVGHQQKKEKGKEACFGKDPGADRGDNQGCHMRSRRNAPSRLLSTCP